MGETEVIIFIVVATLILLVFIGGIIIFIFQYHKRKLIHEKEKAVLNEQHIQDLLNTQVEIQEQTMQDIGREIHDNVGQKLTLASIYTNQLAHAQPYPEIQGRVSEIGTIISESLAELRALSKSLTILNTEGSELMMHIEKECRRVNALNICEVTYEINDTDFKISNTIKNFILRIIQEFIQNSLKHAACKHIKLLLYYFDTGLAITASDDGAGFDQDQYQDEEKKGIGLLNMKKRAELIGAGFTLESGIKKGTTLQLFIPANKLYA